MKVRATAVLLAALLVAPAASESAQKIQPGMLVTAADSSGGCTGNFIYDGLGPRAGATYIGLASHCVGEVADPIAVDRDRVPFGRLVHKNWPLRTIRDDWALIEIFPERLADVDPAQRGNPRFPTGVADEDDVAVGDEIRISGWGAFMYLNEEVQTHRSGVTTYWDGVYHDLAGPILTGDSGGALVHVPSGKALGIVSAFCTPSNFTAEHQPVGCTAFGPSAAEVMREMAKKGFPVRMRLAGEPPPPPAQGAPPPPPPQQAPAQSTTKPPATKKKKRKTARCKTRKQRRSKRCRKARARR